MCPVCLGVLFLAVLFWAVLLPVWSMDQQPHHHLQACQTRKFVSPPHPVYPPISISEMSLGIHVFKKATEGILLHVKFEKQI